MSAVTTSRSLSSRTSREPSATAALPGETAKDNTLIFYQKKFHWAWFIPVDKEVVSLGLVVPTAEFVAHKQTPDAFFRSYLPKINPELARRTRTWSSSKESTLFPIIPTRYGVSAGKVSSASAILIVSSIPSFRSACGLTSRSGVCRPACRRVSQGAGPRPGESI